MLRAISGCATVDWPIADFIADDIDAFGVITAPRPPR
jgi:hypothetical protein